jgi:pyridoxamine 5'-phosphate oxidase
MNVENFKPWRDRLDAAIRAHGGHPQAPYAQLATVRPDGRPANRSVVVRGLLDPGGRPLMTTDARSAKLEQLTAFPWAELCWYFPETREQFRLLGRVTTVNSAADPTYTRVWSALPEAVQRSFTWPAPGARRTQAPAFHLDDPAPSLPPASFTLVVLDPEEVEHLDLKPHPHERTRYLLGRDGWSVEPLNP